VGWGEGGGGSIRAGAPVSTSSITQWTQLTAGLVDQSREGTGTPEDRDTWRKTPNEAISNSITVLYVVTVLYVLTILYTNNNLCTNNILFYTNRTICTNNTTNSTLCTNSIHITHYTLRVW